MDLMKQIEKWKNKIKSLKQEKEEYLAEHCHSSDGDGVWVEFEEKDDFCMELNEKIMCLQDEIDKAEDYLYEKYQWGQE